MTTETEFNTADLLAIEAEARRLRAEVARDLVLRLRGWIALRLAGRRPATARTA